MNSYNGWRPNGYRDRSEYENPHPKGTLKHKRWIVWRKKQFKGFNSWATQKISPNDDWRRKVKRKC